MLSDARRRRLHQPVALGTERGKLRIAGDRPELASHLRLADVAMGYMLSSIRSDDERNVWRQAHRRRQVAR
jgi:hypothetical protein